MSETNGNGVMRGLYSAVGGAAMVVSVVGGILFAGVYKDLDRHERNQDKIETQARAERQDIEARLKADITAIQAGRLDTAERIRALEASIVEIETQFRAMATANNIERQMQESVSDLLQQCTLSGGKCTVPDRQYYPSGPGPNGKPH